MVPLVVVLMMMFMMMNVWLGALAWRVFGNTS
jgi:hypothetical protein